MMHATAPQPTMGLCADLAPGLHRRSQAILEVHGMDIARFDRLTRSLTETGSRRRALAAAVGGVLGLSGHVRPEDATASGKCKPKCDECQHCKKGKNGKQGKCKSKPYGTVCSSGNCQGGRCLAATCSDGFKNGSETGVDCGGACKRCVSGLGCTNRNDCASNLCSGGTCQACTGFPCDTDANGGCICYQSATGGEHVCSTRVQTGGFVQDCNACPAGTVCLSVTQTSYACHKPCGAPDSGPPSDRNLKTNIASIDPVDMLERVRALPITTWNYISDDVSIRHIGPMAQDFAALFAVGADDRHIHSIDGQGVALAAIQGLWSELAQVREENAHLAARLERLEDAPSG